MTKQTTKIERDVRDMRDAGYGAAEAAQRVGLTTVEVRALWERDDVEEDAELNALCDARVGQIAIEVDIDKI